MAQKVWHLGREQDEAAAERLRQDFLPRLTEGKHYRATILGGFYGNQKFAHAEVQTDEEKEFYREVYGFPLYLNVLFSGGFFLFEKMNPVWGDGLFLNRRIFYYVFPGEMTAMSDIFQARIFAQSFGDDKAEQEEAVIRLKPYPHPDYFFIGQKDIFLMFGEDEAGRKILWDEIHRKR